MNLPLFLAQAAETAAVSSAPSATSEFWTAFFNWAHWDKVIPVLVILVIGYPLVFIASRALGRIAEKNLSIHHGLIVGKFSRYFGFIILAVTLLHNLGLQLTAVLGAAGVGAVAVGFAAQTSLSNVISGLFLLGEKPFSVGDFIEVGGTKGTVLGIDLLSVKVRTVDNLFIRIPNESLIKANLTNLTRFPIRRVDLTIGVAYRHDLRKVLAVIREVADANPHCLDEPEPFIMVQGYGESSVDITVGLWAVKTKLVQVRTSFLCDLKERFDRDGIEIPFPHISFHPAVGSAPLPVQMVKDGNVG